MAILRFSPLVLAKFGKLLLIIVVDNSWPKIGFLVELVQTSSLIAFERFTEMKKQKPASKASKKRPSFSNVKNAFHKSLRMRTNNPVMMLKGPLPLSTAT